MTGLISSGAKMLLLGLAGVYLVKGGGRVFKWVYPPEEASQSSGLPPER
jgi:hypothetical protein